MSLSIRSRLTLWYTAVLSLVLAVAAITFHFVYPEPGSPRSTASSRAWPHSWPERSPRSWRRGWNSRRRPMTRWRTRSCRADRWPFSMPREPGLPAAGRDCPHRRRRRLGAGAPERDCRDAVGPFRIHWTRHHHDGTTFQVGVAEPLAPFTREMAVFRRTLLVSVFFALVLAAAGGWWIAGTALRPVATMAAETRRITDRTPGFRLTSPHPRDELGQLARPSTTCSPAWSPRSPSSGSSWPTRPTSCGRRYPSRAPRSR